jgi:hypothetical protein
MPSDRLFAEGSDTVTGWKTQRLAQVGDRGLSQILHAQQRLVRGFTNFADGLDASRVECVPNPRCQSNMIDRCIVWKIWSW